MILHIANKNYSSWSLRPWVLLRELDIPFEERLFAFGGDVGFQTFSPTAQVPCLHEGSIVVWDSLAIVEHIADRYSGVWPTDQAARAWARSAAAEMHCGFPFLREQCSMSIGVRIRLHEIGPGLRADLERVSALWSEGLSRFGGPFLAGSTFTAVDAFYVPVAFRMQTYGLPLEPVAADYAARLLRLDSVGEWQTAALAETWRDERHDAVLPKWGRVTHDLRNQG